MSLYDNLACVHAASVAVHSVTFFWHTGPVILAFFYIYTSLGCLDSGDRSKSSGLWKLDEKLLYNTIIQYTIDAKLSAQCKYTTHFSSKWTLPYDRIQSSGVATVLPPGAVVRFAPSLRWLLIIR